MALFKKKSDLPERPDGMSDTEYIALLIKEDKDYDKHNDGSHIDNMLILNIMHFVEHNAPELSDQTKLHITGVLMEQYESEQEWSENEDGTRTLITGNSENEIAQWLLDENNTNYAIHREYRKETTVEDVALKLFQIADVQTALAKQHVHDFEMRLSKHMFWQTKKEQHLTADTNFLDFLIDNYPDISRKLLDLPNLEELTSDTWYCRIVSQFGIKYYPEENYTERYKYQIAAEWIAQCPEMAECLYDLWEQMIFDPNYLKTEFDEFWSDK